MSEFSYTKDGIKTYTRYTIKGVPTLTTVFPEASTTASLLKKKKEFKNTALQRVYNTHTNSQLVRVIFGAFLRILLDKVADGHLFLFPGTSGAYIALKKTPDKEVKHLRQNGFFKGFDILKAGFTIPRFTFDFGPRSRRRDLQIYVGSTLLQKALRNAEKGLLSYLQFPKRKV